MAWHSDDEKELGKNPVIGSVSFGAERTFKLRHKQYKENNLKQSIVLKNGSFLLMKGATQHHWMHEIPRTAKPIGPRINLTFRVIKYRILALFYSDESVAFACRLKGFDSHIYELIVRSVTIY